MTQTQRASRKKMDALNILRRARRALGRHGWTKGEFRSGDGQVCAMGALSLGAGADPYAPYPHGVRGARAALNALRETAGALSIEGWNDDDVTTEDDVMEAFSSAINRVRRRREADRRRRAA